MATWVRTQTNSRDEQLVNLDNAENVVTAPSVDAHGVYAEFPRGRVCLTYFDGPDSERLCQYALIALWGELKAGVRYIDMASICDEALAMAEEMGE